MKTRYITTFAWVLSLLVCALAVTAWGQDFGGELEDLNAYILFPLLGLLAFSLMWTHYIVGALRRFCGVDKAPLKSYFAVTGWAAIVFILLHPSLLIWQLWRDGAGLPPGSYQEFVGPAMKWAVMLGTLSFLIFLSFEAKRWFSKKGWWPIIEHANIVAMFAIVAHSLALGSNLQTGWFRLVWLWYAISLLISVGYIYYVEAKQAKKEGQLKKKVIAIVLVAVAVTGIAGYAYTQLKDDNQAVSSREQPASQEVAQPEISDQRVFGAE